MLKKNFQVRNTWLSSTPCFLWSHAIQTKNSNTKSKGSRTRRLREVYIFIKCFSLNSLSYSFSLVLLNNIDLQVFYRYKVLNNQGIKLIQ